MKKTVAVFIAFYIISMGVMVGWGFLDKQSKENSAPPTPTTNKNTSTEPIQNNTSTQTDSTGPAASTTKSYTLSDLAKHKTANDCWVAIRGNVYDVTSYLDFHPGGADLILMVCGQDATNAYNTQGGRGRGHSSRADAQLAQYIIGTLK